MLVRSESNSRPPTSQPDAHQLSHRCAVITLNSTLYKEQSDLQATPEETASKSGQSTEKSCLENLVAEFNPEKATGPPISEKLAELTNGLLKEGLSKDQISTINQKYLKPKNCPFLEAPKVNNLLWNQLKQEPKNLDMSYVFFLLFRSS